MTTRWMIPLAAAAVIAVAADGLAQTPAMAPPAPARALTAVITPAPAPGMAAAMPPVPVPPPPPPPNMSMPPGQAALPQPPDAPMVTLVPGQGVPPPPPPPPAPDAPKVTQKVTAPPAAPLAAQPSRARGQLVNLRLEFTITDQIGTKPPVKKSIVMNVADGEFGRIRTNNEGQWRTQWRVVPLSIDASPEIEGGRIRLRLSLEFQSQDEPAAADQQVGFSKVQQSVTCIVADGVPMALTISADPVTDRKVTLDVKATIAR